MKLLTQTTIYYLLISLGVFTVGGYLTYHILQDRVGEETDWFLRAQVRSLAVSIEKGAPIEALNSDKLQIKPLSGEQKKQTFFKDTLIYHRFSKREEPFRKLESIRQIKGQWYQISLVDLVVETEDIIQSVIRSLSIIFALLALVLVLFNVLISRQLLMPFEKTMVRIKRFRLQDAEQLNLPSSRTREFSQLNVFLSNMTEKMQRDYRSLKEFSENASHEMQTPIAIAKGKLELLLEGNELNEEQVRLIQAAYTSLLKLSKLGQSLSLLSRIENREFADFRPVQMSRLVHESLYNFEEIIALKDLQLSSRITENVQWTLNPYLTDMLLTNLLQNAVRHNHFGGQIQVNLQSDHLVIRNTGPEPAIPPALLFERFRKNPDRSESVGLGLAIVQKICEVSGLKVNYHYEDGWHTVAVRQARND